MCRHELKDPCEITVFPNSMYEESHAYHFSNNNHIPSLPLSPQEVTVSRLPFSLNA